MQMIKDMQEEIRLEKYNTERQVLLEEREAAMRNVQLEETLSMLHDYKDAFMQYLAAAEEEENVNIAISSHIYNKQSCKMYVIYVYMYIYVSYYSNYLLSYVLGNNIELSIDYKFY
jgi:transcriptional regulator of heat shock response